MLNDAEMLARLRYLYGSKRVDDIAEEWARMRRNGLGNFVDERKRRYCRRMYNLSQYLKTLSPLSRCGILDVDCPPQHSLRRPRHR